MELNILVKLWFSFWLVDIPDGHLFIDVVRLGQVLNHWKRNKLFF